jgi:hypothetical protein
LIHLTQAEYDELQAAKAERDRLHALINTPELVDFAKAVHLEAVHQEDRWGTPDREGKQPYDWHWLVAHLCGRALEHHKEAERLAARGSDDPNGFIAESIAHHREKAVHHTITAAAALSHWHAAVLGKHTSMQPGSHAAATACGGDDAPLTTIEGKRIDPRAAWPFPEREGGATGA